jgi:uncharacterized membrane-anchored protein YhcB (DUF1043 family)
LKLKNGVTDLVKNIHFTPEVPENHNIKLMSKKQSLLQTFNNGAWHPCDGLIRKGYRILFQHIATSENEKVQELSQTIQNYLVSLMNRDGTSYYDLRRESYIMILDNTLIVMG